MSACSLACNSHKKLLQFHSQKILPVSASKCCCKISCSPLAALKKVNKMAFFLGMFATMCRSFMHKKICRIQEVNVIVTFYLHSSAGLQQAVSRTVPTSERVQGMVLRSKSVPQDKMVPFVNIPLADGQVSNSSLKKNVEYLQQFNCELTNTILIIILLIQAFAVPT